MLPDLVLKNKALLTFILATVIFVVSRWIFFSNYNGADDLHYAMLAANMINGQFNPFEPGDIFSGRILLISLQAVIYKTFGISVISTSAGTIIATIATCYLTIFRFLQHKKADTIFILCCLFYFSPVLTNSITGIMPDAYIMLAGVILLLILKKSVTPGIGPFEKLAHKLLVGIVIAFALLLKETAIVFLPFSIIFYFINNKKQWISNSLAVLLSFVLVVFIFGVVYYLTTNDPFFRIQQIKNSEYPNPCNFANQHYSALLKRLTYGVWQRFISSGYYPVILGSIASFVILIERKKISNSLILNNVWHFVSLLFIGLYLPFSLKGYSPLCDEPRHFLFLIPFAVIAFSGFVDNDQFTGKRKLFLDASLFLISLFCISSTPGKWQWLIYALLLSVSCFSLCFKWSNKQNSFLVAIALVISVFEGVYLPKNNWFSQMKKVNAIIKSDCLYFTNRDIMMHWKLLKKFDGKNIAYFNLDKNASRISRLYNKDPYTAPFHPGWLIVVKNHYSTPKELADTIESTSCCKFYSYKIEEKNLFAIFLETPEQLNFFKSFMK